VKEQQYGNAILSKLPIQLVYAKALPTITGRNHLETRGAMWVTLDIDGTRLHVINTHLGLFRRERLNQIEALLGKECEALLGKEWIDHPDCANPVIMTGDFNALPNSEVCRRIKSKFRDAQEHLRDHWPKPTWGGRFPFSRIDHVFISAGIKVLNVKVTATRLDRTASDHLPLIVDVEVENEDERNKEDVNCIDENIEKIQV
jgi:endonuclease/exonuclease/phosphatase family metal-dependent hydrolase